MEDRTCILEGCNKPPRSKSEDICPMHYHRMYRHGSYEKSASIAAPSVSHGRRYRQVYRPNHPLAHKDGRVYVHRMVLFDTIGPGEHPCHWCGKTVVWGPKSTPNILVPDHLDGFGDNNTPENLVPSCMPCNGGRGSQARHDALVAAGWWSVNDTVAVTHPRRPRVGGSDGRS